VIAPSKTDRPAGRRGGFSLLEAVVAVGIVGGLLVVALNTVGSARYGQYRISQRGRGLLLAQELMTEILNQAYVEPVDKPSSALGPENSEGSTSRHRTTYDDVDDYNGWVSSPPRLKDGTVMSELIGWERRVHVRWVLPDQFETVSGVETGVKRIEVEVRHNGLLTARLWAVRSDNDQLREGE
jgi:type II secretory pathway pseudopilin PulG